MPGTQNASPTSVDGALAVGTVGWPATVAESLGLPPADNRREWYISRLCKAYVRRRLLAAARGPACLTEPEASVGDDMAQERRACPHQGARTPLPAGRQHAHMWAPPKADRSERGGRRHMLGRHSASIVPIRTLDTRR
jgi:hypothetical protein